MTPAEHIAREIHSAYVRLAPDFDVEVIPWGDLEDYQRDLAIAVVGDVLKRDIIERWHVSD